jgi:uncharacterized membrane protein YoaK (UPF0700 family)
MTTTLTEAWHTLVPPAGDRHGPLAPLLLVLTVVSGLVDAFSYLVLGHVFVANMTGNVVFVGFALAHAPGFSLAASLTALGAFLVGVVSSARLVRHMSSARRGRMLALTTAGEAVLTAAAMVVAWTATGVGTGAPRYVIIVLLGVAMGLQNGTARKLAVPDMTTTVMTMTITGAAFDSRLGAGSGSRIGRRVLAPLALLVGALVGATVVLHVSKPVALLIALVLLVAVTVFAGRLSRSRPMWDKEL